MTGALALGMAAPVRPEVDRPSGAGAVMSGRAATAPEGLDYFPTPPWAARAGGEILRRLLPNAATCWEPACGEGHMAHGLGDTFKVTASDIHDYGWPGAAVVDFLDADANLMFAGDHRPDVIVSNPPFKDGEAFIRRALDRARLGVAMLLRANFREGGGRHALFHGAVPLAMKATFCERVPMMGGCWDPGASSATSYAWFIFLTPEGLDGCPYREPILAARAVDCALDASVPPGTRERLHRDADVVRFGPLAVRWFEGKVTRLTAEVEAGAQGKGKELLEARAAAARIAALVESLSAPCLFGEDA